MADNSELQNRLTGFSYNYLYRDGNIGNKKIHRWHLADDIQIPSGNFGGFSWKIQDNDGDTVVTTEYFSNDNKVRSWTAGTARSILDASGYDQLTGDITVQSSGHIGLDGMQGGTYWVYNANSHYLEGWVDGTKRVEL